MLITNFLLKEIKLSINIPTTALLFVQIDKRKV